MPECEYCAETFADENDHLDHLAEDHWEELGPIDRRRVDQREPTSGSGLPNEVYYGAGIAVVLLFVGGAGWLIMSGVGGEGSIHEHGTIVMTIDGETYSWNQDRYLYESGHQGPFHFHQGDVEHNVWHMHPSRLTLAEAMGELGYVATADALETADETFETVEYRVNGEPVDPEAHELEGAEPINDAIAGEGDDILIEIETEE